MLKTQRSRASYSQNIYFIYSSSWKEDTRYMKQSNSSRIDEILDVVTRPVILRIIKVDENDFPPLLLLSSSVYHVFLSINAPRNKFLPRLTRHLEANDFPFPVKHSLFPLILLVLILSLSVCMYVYTSFHIFSLQIVGGRRNRSLMASFPYNFSGVSSSFGTSYHFKFKIYSYTPRETNSMILTDSRSK